MDKEKSIEVKNMARTIFFWLNVVGCDPQNQNVWAISRWAFMTTYLIVFMTFIFVRVLHTLKEGITFDSVECMLYFVLMYEFLAKYMFYRYYHRDLSERFDTMFDEFWQTDFMAEHRARFDRMHRIIGLLIRSYRINYIVLNFAFTIEPLFYASEKRMLRIPMWLPRDEEKLETPFFQGYYLYQAFHCLSADFVMLHFELMVVFMLGTTYVQIEMIKSKLKTIGSDERFYETIEACVDHHNLMLRHLNKMVSLFSTLMIQQVSAYILAIVLPAYLFGSTRTVNVGFCICAGLHVLNYFLYCLAGQIVHDQCVSVIDAIYECDWWKTSEKRFKTCLLIVMLRSSKGVIFTAGGVVDFTLDTFIKAMKASFSLLQFLWSVNASKNLYE